MDADLARRAAQYAALGDPNRLTFVDELVRSDRSPTELRVRLDLGGGEVDHG